MSFYQHQYFASLLDDVKLLAKNGHTTTLTSPISDSINTSLFPSNLSTDAIDEWETLVTVRFALMRAVLLNMRQLKSQLRTLPDASVISQRIHKLISSISQFRRVLNQNTATRSVFQHIQQHQRINTSFSRQQAATTADSSSQHLFSIIRPLQQSSQWCHLSQLIALYCVQSKLGQITTSDEVEIDFILPPEFQQNVIARRYDPLQAALQCVHIDISTHAAEYYSIILTCESANVDQVPGTLTNTGEATLMRLINDDSNRIDQSSVELSSINASSFQFQGLLQLTPRQLLSQITLFINSIIAEEALLQCTFVMQHCRASLQQVDLQSFQGVHSGVTDSFNAMSVTSAPQQATLPITTDQFTPESLLSLEKKHIAEIKTSLEYTSQLASNNTPIDPNNLISKLSLGPIWNSLFPPSQFSVAPLACSFESQNTTMIDSSHEYAHITSTPAIQMNSRLFAILSHSQCIQLVEHVRSSLQSSQQLSLSLFTHSHNFSRYISLLFPSLYHSVLGRHVLLLRHAASPLSILPHGVHLSHLHQSPDVVSSAQGVAPVPNHSPTALPTVTIQPPLTLPINVYSALIQHAALSSSSPSLPTHSNFDQKPFTTNSTLNLLHPQPIPSSVVPSYHSTRQSSTAFTSWNDILSDRKQHILKYTLNNRSFDHLTLLSCPPPACTDPDQCSQGETKCEACATNRSSYLEPAWKASRALCSNEPSAQQSDENTPFVQHYSSVESIFISALLANFHHATVLPSKTSLSQSQFMSHLIASVDSQFSNIALDSSTKAWSHFLHMVCQLPSSLHFSYMNLASSPIVMNSIPSCVFSHSSSPLSNTLPHTTNHDVTSSFHPHNIPYVMLYLTQQLISTQIQQATVIGHDISLICQTELSPTASTLAPSVSFDQLVDILHAIFVKQTYTDYPLLLPDASCASKASKAALTATVLSSGILAPFPDKSIVTDGTGTEVQHDTLKTVLDSEEQQPQANNLFGIFQANVSSITNQQSINDDIFSESFSLAHLEADIDNLLQANEISADTTTTMQDSTNTLPVATTQTQSQSQSNSPRNWGIVSKPLIFSLLHDFETSVTMLIPASYPNPDVSKLSPLEFHSSVDFPCVLSLSLTFSPFNRFFPSQSAPTQQLPYQSYQQLLSSLSDVISPTNLTSSHFHLIKILENVLQFPNTDSSPSPSMLCSSSSSQHASLHTSFHSSDFPPTTAMIDLFSEIFPALSVLWTNSNQTDIAVISAQYYYSLLISTPEQHQSSPRAQRIVQLLASDMAKQHFHKLTCAGTLLVALTRQLHTVVAWIVQSMRQFVLAQLD